MKTYWVTYQRYMTEMEEVTIAVEADNEEQALEKAQQGDGDEVDWNTWDRTSEEEYWDNVEINEEKEMNFIKGEENGTVSQSL
jgi:hypothetical protein